jgi:hypothetical protein
MNANTFSVQSYNNTGSFCIYKAGVSGSAILYIQYFLCTGKGFLIFLIIDYIYNIYNLSSKLTYLLPTSGYKYRGFYLSSGKGGMVS